VNAAALAAILLFMTIPLRYWNYWNDYDDAVYNLCVIRLIFPLAECVPGEMRHLSA